MNIYSRYLWLKCADAIIAVVFIFNHILFNHSLLIIYCMGTAKVRVIFSLKMKQKFCTKESIQEVLAVLINDLLPFF